MFLNNVIQCINHNVAAMKLLHTGWVAELNFQVSLVNELSAEITIPLLSHHVCKRMGGAVAVNGRVLPSSATREVFAL